MSYGNPTGFVAFDQYLQANEESAEEMARRAGQNATNTPNPEDLQRNVGLLGTQPGAQAFLAKATPKGQKTTALDAALAGQSNYFQQLQQRYGHAGDEDLARRVEAANAQRKRVNQPQPAAPAPPPDARQQQIASRIEAIRKEDAARPSGQMGRERWAALHGMTLDQYVAAGEQPAF